MKQGTGAILISRVFDPFVMLGAAFIVVLWQTSVFLPAFVCMIVVPFVLYVVAWKTRVISNWDVTNRHERPRVLWALVVIEGVSILLFGLWNLVPVFGALAGFSVITHFWKISGHAMASALATGIIVRQFGWDAWPILSIVPLVAWSRVVLKHHSVWQVTAGALWAWLILLVT